MESTHKQGLLYDIALSRLERVGSVHYKNLVSHFGSAEEVFKTPKTKILKISGIGELLANGFAQKDEALTEAETIIEASIKKEIKIITLKSPDYPEALQNVYDPPPILYVKGNGEFQPSKTLAIVGTRDATNYGKSVVNQLIQELKGVQIISGLALGIDITAHKAALKNGLSTIAVLGNGLDMVYPSLHKKVAEEILENGLLVSEQPVFTKIHPQFFVARNRIIAALSEISLVVESDIKGGSMVTAECANNYNKEVFAVPGEVQKKQSKGTNKLIFTNKANIYTTPEALIDWMQWNMKPKKPIKVHIENHNAEEKAVLTVLLERGEMQIDDLSWHSQIPPNRLSYILINLEFQDIVKQSPGKKFSIKKR